MKTETIIEKSTRLEYQIEVKHAGENPQKCPVCSEDRKPQNKNKKVFSFNASTGLGKCQNCDANFYRKTENHKAYVRPVWENKTELPDAVIEWFQSRNINADTLKAMKVTSGTVWMPQVDGNVGVVCFNYFKDGHLINVKYRDRNKNFRLVKDAQKVFYNLDGIKDQKEIWIVEGEIDCLTMVQAGITNCCSVPNGANAKNNNLEYLDSCWQYFENVEYVYILTDTDQPGNQLADELARRIGAERCYRVKMEDCKDVNEAVSKGFKISRKYLLGFARAYPLVGVFTAESFWDDLLEIRKHGFPKGWKPRAPFGNHATIHPGYTSIITGIPGHGKSEHLDQILIELGVDYNLKGAYFSPENWPTSLHLMKIVEKVSGKNFWDSNLNEIESVKDWINDHMFWTYPEDGFNLANVLEHVRKAVLRHGINWYVIDPWNKLDHQYTGQETKYISESLDMIDTFNKKYNVHAFIIAHPTKMDKEKDGINYVVPNLYSISGSAHFFNKAALGWTVYKKGKGVSEVHVQKVKFKYWGEIGLIDYLWDEKTGRYYTVNPDYSNWIVRDKKQTLNFYEPTNENDDVPF
jgi:twinkle protein